jgi:hypothetical protein
VCGTGYAAVEENAKFSGLHASRPDSLSVLCEAGSRGRRSSPDPATAALDERSEGNLPLRNEPVLTFI